MSTPAGAMTCAVCGAGLEPGAVFCGACGARVTAVAAVGAAEPVGPSRVPAAAEPVVTPPVRAADAGWSLGADVDDAVAPVWRRLVALLVDQALAVLVGSVGLLAVLPALRSGDSLGALLVPGLLLLLLAAGQWFAEAFGRRTVGGALLGARTVSARTGRAPGLWAVLVRSVVQALGALVGGIGVYVVAGSGAWDEGPEQRGWHDKAAGTLVLRVRPLRREEASPASEAAATPAPVARRAEPTSGPPRPSTEAMAPSAAPAAPAAPPVVPTSGPPVPAPAEQDPAVVEPELAPVEPIPAPVELVPEPVEAVPAPVEPTPAPFEVTPAAVEPTPEPTAPRHSATPATQPTPAAPVPATAAESVPAAPVAPAPDAPSGLPDSTVPTAGLGDLEHTRVGRWAGSLDAASSTLALVLDTGERVPVTGPGLIGRRPVPGGEQWDHLITVDDPEQSVSSTHLAFWPVDGGLDVVDRGSTNGTVLLDAAGKPWTLPPDQPARVGAGWTLVLGAHRIAVSPA